MGLHTELDIYKTGYTLMKTIIPIIGNMPRDYKASIGGEIRDICVRIMVLIFRANASRDKEPHLLSLIENLQIAEMLLRAAVDLKMISRGQYAAVIEITTSVGKQCGGWRKYSAASAS